MSTRSDRSRRQSSPHLSQAQSSPPFVGALLRMCWEKARHRLKEAIRADGFDDIEEAHLPLFRYPPPDGVKPSVLARQCGMSRQATNYLIAQLEGLGYLERRAKSEGSRRLVYLTKRGRRIVETIHASMRALEEEWAVHLGRKRFGAFMDVLRILAAEDAKPDRG